jgi:phage terminase large subunit GpA-like protein
MMIDANFNDLIDILESGRQKISNVLPSMWAEQKRVLTSDISAFPGKFTFDRTPYLIEPVNLLSPDSPAKYIAVMKGGQIGFSTGVIENGIGWIISENPGPIMFLSGHQELSEEAMNKKIDQMIDSCGLKHLIRPNVVKKRNNRTGDTAKSKEFPGGSLTAGAASNHSLLRQRSIKYGFYDDFENAPKASKESGSTERMIQHRHAAYQDKMKIYYISTPELKATSNIEPVFLKGDQRRYMVPCPCCHVYIPLLWSADITGTDGREKGGIAWKLDEHGKLIPESVGYICQECGEFFDDSHKYEMNLKGYWAPTAEPSEVGYYSYHISCLYAPPGMFDWTYYVRQYLEANPPGQPQIEHLQKTFVNLALAETFEPTADALNANDLQKNNIRTYPVGIVPESVSIKDGNGHIVLITCAADMNGVVDDARIDYEIVAWSETGASYSIKHGSIGTFVFREGTKKHKEDRKKWTYEHNKPNSVWPELTKIFDGKLLTDLGTRVRIQMTGLDCGQYSNFAYPYIDKFNSPVRIGLKGRDDTKFTKLGADLPVFHLAKERSNLYLVEVNVVKDDLADYIRLRWDDLDEGNQPPGFLNFPQPSEGLYLYNNYFSHFESEQKIAESKDGIHVGFRWKKKTANAQNHFWDCRVYNIAVKEIFISIILKALGYKKFTWQDYVNVATGNK